MKLFNKICIGWMAIFSILLVSCERELETDIISTTPPALLVIVKDEANVAVAGAQVKLYNEEAAWDAEGSPVDTRETDASGKVEFPKEVLQNPGVFYLVTSKDALKVKSKTPFLILNDGKTHFNVTLK